MDSSILHHAQQAGENDAGDDESYYELPAKLLSIREKYAYCPPARPPKSTSLKRTSSAASDHTNTQGGPSTIRDRKTIPGKKAGSSSPSKRRKVAKAYAPPEVYEHLSLLHDCLKPELDVVFCGINPGYRSAEIGHHFAHPSNHFWKCLHQAGFTPDLVSPTDDFNMPDKYNFGLTDLTERASRQQTELSRAEQAAGVEPLLRKIAKYRPRIICFLGLGIWDIVSKHISKIASPAEGIDQKRQPRSTPGLQAYKLVHEPDGAHEVNETLFYALVSPSGLVGAYQLSEKVELFRKLRQVVEEMKGGQGPDTKYMSVLSSTSFI